MSKGTFTYSVKHYSHLTQTDIQFKTGRGDNQPHFDTLVLCILFYITVVLLEEFEDQVGSHELLNFAK